MFNPVSYKLAVEDGKKYTDAIIAGIQATFDDDVRAVAPLTAATIDATLVPGVKYYILSAPASTLTFGYPSSGVKGSYCYLQFISGSTPTALTMDLTYAAGGACTPSANSLCAIIAEWNGVKWVLVSTETPISVTIGAHPTYAAGAMEITVGATATMNGLTYQWQDSADNVTFANMTGKTAVTLAVADMTATKHYRCVVSALGAVSVNSNSTQYAG
jgi:hypothetical protein